MSQKQFWMPCRFHEALSAPAREKLALGVEFKRIFRFGEESEPTPERLCELYAGRDTEQKGIRQAAVGVLYADQMARYYGKPLSQLSLEDNQIAISLGSICNDSKEELGKFFNGEEARLGSISQTYKTVMAAHTMKQIEAA